MDNYDISKQKPIKKNIHNYSILHYCRCVRTILFANNYYTSIVSILLL